MAVHKKHEEPKKEDPKEESKSEAVVVSDTVTETTERIETEAPVESSSPEDPLTDFKEKMTEEEEQPVASRRPQKNYMWPILFVVFLALVFLIGIFVYKQGTNKRMQVNVVTLSPTPTAIPQPTIAIDLDQYEIKVLNGSEVGGEAGRQKANLEAEGFTISSVGNADDSNYTETIIQAKKEVDQAYLNKLKSVLEESFVVGAAEELSEDADSNVIVIIGSETN